MLGVRMKLLVPLNRTLGFPFTPLPMKVGAVAGATALKAFPLESGQKVIEAPSLA
jgi:hypothetical protein